MSTDENLTAQEAIEIWKRAVETQMHFNEMSTKSRQLGLTFVVAALGLSVVLLSRGEDVAFEVSLCGSHFFVHVSVLIVVLAAIALFAVMKLDLDIYHKMLRGAVKFGEEFEQAHLVKLMGTSIGMTGFISLYSRNDNVKKHTDGSFIGTGGKNAGEKLSRFYITCIFVLVLIATLLFAVTQTESFSAKSEKLISQSDQKK